MTTEKPAGVIQDSTDMYRDKYVALREEFEDAVWEYGKAIGANSSLGKKVPGSTKDILLTQMVAARDNLDTFIIEVLLPRIV